MNRVPSQKKENMANSELYYLVEETSIKGQRHKKTYGKELPEVSRSEINFFYILDLKLAKM